MKNSTYNDINFNIIEDVTMNMTTAIELAEAYVNEHIAVPEIVNIGKIIDDMREIFQPQIDMFDAAKYLQKRTK